MNSFNVRQARAAGEGPRPAARVETVGSRCPEPRSSAQVNGTTTRVGNVCGVRRATVQPQPKRVQVNWHTGVVLAGGRTRAGNRQGGGGPEAARAKPRNCVVGQINVHRRKTAANQSTSRQRR